MTYQWYKNGVAISGATSRDYSFLTLLGSDSGVYRVKVTNAGGYVMSDNAYLNIVPPPTITTQPQSQAVPLGGTASFSVTASSSESISYQWYFNGASLGGAGTSPTYSITNANTGNAGNYTIVAANATGPTTSQVATLTVILPPGISMQPKNKAVPVGQTAMFKVTATGSAPLMYQWSFNGASLSAGTSSILALTNVQTNDAGPYQVVITNAAGSITSTVATLTVIVPPVIVSPPLSQTVTVGQDASFSVTATGTGPLSYQWTLNGTPLSAGASSTLALTNVQINAAGAYQVVITNAAGSVTSTVATLTVIVPPAIVSPPLSQTTRVGQDATFSVTATGTGPLSYQWALNGTPLSGATSSVLALTNVQTNEAGSYTVIITNAANSITSSVATLTVTTPLTSADIVLALNGNAAISYMSLSIPPILSRPPPIFRTGHLLGPM